MVSAFSHAAFAVAAGTLLPRERLPRRAWILGAIAAAAPDLDYFLHQAGVSYDSPYGHRGFTHSLAFAAAVGVATAAIAAWRRWPGSAKWWGGYTAACMASHGVLDAFTNGGNGIAFLWPFSDERWFAPWTPIRVAPLSIRGFFTASGARVFASELLWVWLPSWSLAAIAWLVRRTARRAQAS